MVPDQRLRFMKEARRNASQNPCALLDEASILFLATRPGRTRGDMFAIALPAGGVQPYSNASSKSSPEMFFGREQELALLWDQGGSCLVYGDRQLGKTALLQQVRVRYHRPPSQVVAYGSLQGKVDVWALIASLLRESDVPCQRATRSGVATSIDHWLQQDGGRRLLLLLLIDEADDFLSYEMTNDYRKLIVVRDLMRDTERRCKFVFAGLHDVQRIARTPNSPLHHFGMPLGIGPLFGKDIDDARRMATVPMAAAGIEFDGLSLPSRILSAVGFYPSLMQTFGSTLLNQINNRAESGIRLAEPLPILVGEKDIDSALEDQDFKRDIGEKSQMTLELDKRYQLITLAMVHRTLALREQGEMAGPLTDVKIQELALGWWRQGFADDASLSAFQGLLQEMIGLGVLLKADGGFVIRSSRIAAMLGGKEQIDQKLIELSVGGGLDKPDTGSLRRYENDRPAPLTYRQEGLLSEWTHDSPFVYLVLASKALGSHDLADCLQNLEGDELAVRHHRYATSREFESAVQNALQAAQAGRRSLAVLSGPWFGRDMVDMARNAVAHRRNSRKLRLLLLPDIVDWEEVDRE